MFNLYWMVELKFGFIKLKNSNEHQRSRRYILFNSNQEDLFNNIQLRIKEPREEVKLIPVGPRYRKGSKNEISRKIPRPQRNINLLK